MTAFLDLESPFSNYDQASTVVMLVPYEASTTYGKGTADGPEAIVAASRQLELYDEELDAEIFKVGIATDRPFKKFSADPPRAVAQIATACKVHLDKNKFVIGVGGEHSMTVGMVEAFSTYYKDICVLQLDAHSDLRDNYLGSKYNHACVMRRVSEICPYVGVGIRSGISGERHLITSPSAIVYAHEMADNESWMDEVVSTLRDHVYITIDLDFFDPSIVPSVGTPEPGGFYWYETLMFLKKVIAAKQILGFDVVELSPKQGWPASDFIAAKLIYKLIGYIHKGKKHF